MRLQVLGCYGTAVGDYKTTAFLINDSILLDAGTITEVLDDEKIEAINDVIITHPHIDHVKGLFSFIDEALMLGINSIRLISAKEILKIISTNLFNNLIWPDVTVIPSIKDPVISLSEIPLERETVIGDITIKPVLMSHTVYTVGYIVKSAGKGFMFTSDTGPTKRFWEVAAKEKGIEFIIADVSFPNRLERLATVSGHMTLSMLIEHMDRYGLGGMPCFINHLKPLFIKEVADEITASNRKNLRLLKQGEVITL
jgi:ribonuclease BN (tRNA processing enzyme)